MGNISEGAYLHCVPSECCPQTGKEVIHSNSKQYSELSHMSLPFDAIISCKSRAEVTHPISKQYNDLSPKKCFSLQSSPANPGQRYIFRRCIV